jgi:hypothetical protein
MRPDRRRFTFPDRPTRWLLTLALILSIIDAAALAAHLIFGLGK